VIAHFRYRARLTGLSLLPKITFPGKRRLVRRDRFEGEGDDAHGLPYPTNGLEPHIDALTMEIRHDRHHGGLCCKIGINRMRKWLSDQQRPNPVSTRAGASHTSGVRWPIRTRGARAAVFLLASWSRTGQDAS
jgi:Iron/manganese superoxide dismutases, alpha-hairpin domain